MPRQKLLLPFGGGLDRKTGSAVVDPDAHGNLQNVYLFKGRTELRRGLQRVFDIGWGQDIIGIFPVRSIGVSALVVWDEVTRKVRLYLTDGALTSASLVGDLWTMPAAFSGRPVVSAADMYGQLVIAHDDASLVTRQATKIFTASTGLITTLQADLDRDTTANDVKFRGVRRHLNYLVGWGYGTDSDEDRPEVLRISNAGAITFTPEHYFLVGAKGDPILGVGKCGIGQGAVLGLYKAAEAYRLDGNEPRNFGVFLMDDTHGILGPRLEVTVGAENFRWTLNGPVVTTGGEAVDLEMPLDIAGPEADPLQTAVESDNAFAFYDPEEKEVAFVFDFWAYVLHLRDRSRRWSFRPYAWELASAGLIYTGGPVLLKLADPVVAATYVDPPFNTAVVPDNYMPKFDVTWTNSGALIGGEQAEVWVRSLYAGDTVDSLGLGYGLSQGEWKKRATVAATALAATVMGMHFHTNHEIAVRLTYNGVPGVGYFGAPDTWPASSRIAKLALGAISAFPVPTFSRTNASEVRVSFAYAGPGMNGRHLQPQLTYVVEKSLAGAGAWSSAATVPEVVVQPNSEKEQRWDYRIKVIGPHGESALVTQNGYWVGPDPPTSIIVDTNPLAGVHNHFIQCGNYGANGGVIEFRGVHYTTLPPNGTYSATVTVGPAPAAPEATVSVPDDPARPRTPRGEARTKLDSGLGVIDYSDWIVDTAANET